MCVSVRVYVYVCVEVSEVVTHERKAVAELQILQRLNLK